METTPRQGTHDYFLVDEIVSKLNSCKTPYMRIKILTFALTLAILAPTLSSCTSKGNVFSLDVGDCVNGSIIGEVENIDIVNCSSPHEGEIFAEFNVNRDSWPGASYLDSLAENGCISRFKSYVGVSYESSIWYVSFLRPTEESWKQVNDREVTCVIQPEYGKTSTKARNSRT